MCKKLSLRLFLVVFIVLSCFGMFSACSSGSYIEGYNETVEGYGGITTNVLTKDNIDLHIEAKLVSSKKAMYDISDIINNDYKTLENIWNRKTKVKIYIIADEYILGVERGAYINGNIICNLDAVKDGSYKLYLTGAYLNTTETWKQYAACQYAFSLWDIEAIDFKTYYANSENILSLTMFAAYFNAAFSNKAIVDMAKQTSYAFGNFVLANYGLNEFLSTDMVQHRQEWLDSIECGRLFDIPFDLSWLDGARYSRVFLRYPLVITTDNRKYYLDGFGNARPSASFDTAERVLYHLSQGYDESKKLLEYMRDNSPTSYSFAVEKFQSEISYYISDRELQTSCDVDNNSIYLLDPSEYVHETMHAVTLSKNPTDGAWLCEGVAEYFSRYVSDLVSDRNHRFYAAFTTSGLSGSLGQFVNAVNARYEAMGGRLDSIDVFDFALMAESIGITTLLSPEYKSNIVFPYATDSIYDSYRNSHSDGNILTYPEAYTFTKYLIDEYGLDKVLQCCTDYKFEQAFGNSYSVVFAAFSENIGCAPN